MKIPLWGMGIPAQKMGFPLQKSLYGNPNLVWRVESPSPGLGPPVDQSGLPKFCVGTDPNLENGICFYRAIARLVSAYYVAFEGVPSISRPPHSVIRTRHNQISPRQIY